MGRKPKTKRCKKCPCGMTGSLTIITEDEVHYRPSIVPRTQPPPTGACKVYRGPPPGHPGHMEEENVPQRRPKGHPRYQCGHCGNEKSSCVIQ